MSILERKKFDIEWVFNFQFFLYNFELVLKKFIYKIKYKYIIIFSENCLLWFIYKQNIIIIFVKWYLLLIMMEL